MANEEQKKALNSLGARLRQLRNEKGLTQVELGARVNKDQQAIQRLEAGRVNPSYLFLKQIAEGLEVEFNVLFDF